MTLVSVNSRPINKNFNILMDAFLPGFASILKQDLSNTVTPKHRVPVNIKETEADYQVEVVAPGFTKEDFRINLEADLLTISAEKKEEVQDGNKKMIRKEYTPESFSRSFSVDDTINTEAISAQYVKGILTLNLPKKEAVKPVTKEISVQ